MVGKVTHWLMEAARLAAIVFFMFCLNEGFRKGGGSTIVFMGVLALSTTLLVGYIVERMAIKFGQ